MREFEQLELSKQKCFICGCKNKLHTEILDNTNMFIGYQVKCCGCGNIHDFILNSEINGKDKRTPYYYGVDKCFQLSRCNHKECPLYGTYVENNSIKIEKGNNKKMCNNDMCDINFTLYDPPRFL